MAIGHILYIYTQLLEIRLNGHNFVSFEATIVRINNAYPIVRINNAYPIFEWKAYIYTLPMQLVAN